MPNSWLKDYVEGSDNSSDFTVHAEITIIDPAETMTITRQDVIHAVEQITNYIDKHIPEEHQGWARGAVAILHALMNDWFRRGGEK